MLPSLYLALQYKCGKLFPYLKTDAVELAALADL